MQLKKYFTSRDLSKIKRWTNINNHSENYVFIAHKINSKLEKEFREIVKKINVKGYLDGVTSSQQHILYQKLMEELRTKSPDEYEEVYSRT